MKIQFPKRFFTSEFESPFKNFQTVKQSGEIRSCPVTGHVSRILPMRLREFARMDLQPLLDQSRPAGCPFCPENIEEKTPRFPKQFPSENGRIVRGETLLFSNAFPHDALSLKRVPGGRAARYLISDFVSIRTNRDTIRLSGKS